MPEIKSRPRLSSEAMTALQRILREPGKSVEGRIKAMHENDIKILENLINTHNNDPTPENEYRVSLFAKRTQAY